MAASKPCKTALRHCYRISQRSSGALVIPPAALLDANGCPSSHRRDREALGLTCHRAPIRDVLGSVGSSQGLEDVAAGLPTLAHASLGTTLSKVHAERER